MYEFAEKIFYSLSMLVLGAALFIMSPSQNSTVADFQNEVSFQFQTATIQVFGDQPVFDDTKFVIESIYNFYDQSADAALALLQPTPAEADLNNVVAAVYQDFQVALSSSQARVAGVETSQVEQPANFMQEEPIYNLLPEQLISHQPAQADIPVASTDAAEYETAINQNNPWANLRDNTTGQIYCVAVFNSQVSQYLGPCKNEYH